MVDIDALKAYISDSGITMTALANKAGITRPTLYSRLDGVGEFTASEIIAVSKALKMTRKERDDIFLVCR